MLIQPAANLACPLDGEPLSLEEKQLTCPHGHSFDIAKQGYVNLLPVQQKRSKHPGDSKEMVTARTEFLDSGVYQPIADRLAELVIHQLSAPAWQERSDLCLLDAGCGEGYYFNHLLNTFVDHDSDKSLSMIGIDIAKPAILAATKRNKRITWLVASNKNPPLLPASVDMIICMFGFPDFKQFKSLLRPGGLVILVDPGSEHLIELREIIYPTVKKSPPSDLGNAEASGFTLQKSSALCYQTEEIDQQSILNLLTMTPHLYKASHEGKQAARALQHIQLTVDIVFRCLKSG